MPFFSVVIPAYNRGNLLREALQSVFAQEHTDYEVIVVDDGSTEDIAAIAREFGDRVRCLRQENRGPGAARNLGIADATGEYVAFLDSDDLWFPWTLSVYQAAIDETPSASFVAGAATAGALDDACVDQAPAHKVKVFADYLATASAGIWIGTCGAAIKRNLLIEINGFEPDRMNAEDSDLWMRLGTAPGFTYVLEPPVFIYRSQPSSEISHHGQSFRGISRLIERETSGKYPGGASRARERRQILGRHVRPVALASLKHGHWRQAWDLYSRTFFWHVAERRLSFLGGFPLLTTACILSTRWRLPPRDHKCSPCN